MSSDNYNISCEPDSTDKSNGPVFLVFLICGVLLTLMIWGLTIMFKFQVDHEKTQKIGLTNTTESHDARIIGEAYLSGKQGVFPDKKFVDINQAKQKFLFEFRR